MKKIVSIAVVLVMLFSLFAGTQAVVANESAEDIAPVFYNKPISDSMVGKGREDSFSSGIDYSFSNNNYYAFSNSDGSVSFTRKSEATTDRAAAYFSLGAAKYVLDHGSFIFKTNLTVSDPSHNITLVADDMSKSAFENTSLVKNGMFLSTDIPCESDATYEVEIIYDLDNNTKTYKINGDIIGDVVTISNPIAQVRSFSVNWYAGGAPEGAKITFDDLQLLHTTRVPFEILSPVQGEIVENQQNVHMSVSVPGDYTDVKFYLDGNEITSVSEDNGVYSADVAWEQVNLGIHKFRCTAKDEVGATVVRETNFKTAGSARTVLYKYENIVQGTGGTGDNKPMYTDESCSEYSRISKVNDNRPGSETKNDAIGIQTVTGKFTEIHVNYQDWFKGNTICFDGWIKRDEDACVLFGVKDGSNLCYISRSGSNESRYFIYPDGKFTQLYTSASDKQIHPTFYKETIMPANEWHHIKWTLDTNTYICNIYYDGNLIQSAIPTYIKEENLKPNYVYVTPYYGTKSDVKMYIDDAKLYMIETNVNAVSYNVASDSVSDEGCVIPENADSIVLDMSNAVMHNNKQDKVWSATNVTINGEAVNSVSQNGNQITIVPSKPLSDYENINLELGVHADFTQTEKLGFKAISVYLTHDLGDNIGEFLISSSGEGISASIDISKVNYGASELPDECVIIVASYNNGELAAHTFETKTLANGDNHFRVTLKNVNGGTEYKAFVWNNFESLTPLK